MSHTVLIVDDHASFRGFARRLLEAGGLTIVGEAATAAQAVAAARELDPDETVVDPGLVTELLDAPRRTDPVAELTPREREVLALVAEGRTDRGIAEALWLSPRPSRRTSTRSSASSTCPPRTPRTAACTPCSPIWT